MNLIWAMITALRAPPPISRCANCTHFQGDPGAIEAAIPGMTAMGSAHASVRSSDGICLLRDIYLSARSGCGRFAVR